MAKRKDKQHDAKASPESKSAEGGKADATTEGQSAVGEDVTTGHAIIISAVQSQIVINRETEARNKAAEPHQHTIDEEKISVDGELLQAAKKFANDKTFDVDQFLTWCEGEEKFIKSDEAGEYKVDRVPRCWSQSKSNIKNAWEKFQLNPMDFSSAEKLKQALNDQRKKSRKGGGSESGGAGTGPRMDYPDDLDPRMAQRLAVLATLYSRADDATKDKMLDEVAEKIDEYRHAIYEIVGADAGQLPALDDEFDEELEKAIDAQKPQAA